MFILNSKQMGEFDLNRKNIWVRVHNFTKIKGFYINKKEVR
jgi:hypothetical protein